MARNTYTSIMGCPQQPVVVSLSLPRLGQHDFKWYEDAEIDRAYGHYGFRLYDKATPVNVHVYGERELVEYLARTGREIVCELELMKKKVQSGREFVFVNLYVPVPRHPVSHEFMITKAPKDRPSFVYTTKDMHGVGILVKPL